MTARGRIQRVLATASQPAIWYRLPTVYRSPTPNQPHEDLVLAGGGLASIRDLDVDLFKQGELDTARARADGERVLVGIVLSWRALGIAIAVAVAVAVAGTDEVTGADVALGAEERDKDGTRPPLR